MTASGRAILSVVALAVPANSIRERPRKRDQLIEDVQRYRTQSVMLIEP